MQKAIEPQTSIYFHFPFCEQKCHYCDFFSMAEGKFTQANRHAIYELIIKELDLYKNCLTNQVQTFFLGGGTPSLVPLEFLERILKKLDFATDAEVTIEANPSSVTKEKAEAWKRFGINRVSFGMQALDDSRLHWLDRVHDKKECFQALEAVFGAGLENVSIDYILGVPGQTTSKIESELTEILNLFPKIKHISAYLLTLTPNNPKYTQLPNEEEQLLHLRFARDFLSSYGFEQYEISNFAKPGFESRHNENYWLGGGYLGIGPSAHAFWKQSNLRSKNTSNLHQYEKKVTGLQMPWEWEDPLTLEALRIEYLMLRLRRKAGMNLTEYNELFNEDLSETKRLEIADWVNKDCLSLSPTNLSFQGDGFFLSDQVVKTLV